MEISLLEIERGRGLGGAILRSVPDEAAAASLEVTLHVEPCNRARRLYERLGFAPGERQGVYLFMSWKPPQREDELRTPRSMLDPDSSL